MFLNLKKIFICALFVLSFFLNTNISFAKNDYSKDKAYKEYIKFFEEVYDVVKKNYYKDVSKKQFDKFIEKFNKKIYSQLKSTGKSQDYIKWRSAWFLVKDLKTQEDIFSEFYPPKPAKEYEQTALGKKIDLGIEGKLIDMGFEVTFVEPRSDAYSKGLRANDLIVKLDKKNVAKLDIDMINELLNPLAGSKIKITYINAKTREKKKISVLSKEYFKETVFPIYLNVPGIYGLEIKRFNRETGEDVFRFIEHFKNMGKIKGLIMDMRGNPGGPPLAARELASFFLPAGEEFAYFQKRGEDKATLDVPSMAEKYKYEGPMVIFINKKSGSAAELFSGVMQKRGRAILMGKNSAGQVMLKSMFHFDDGSMVLLVTARGHHPDGSVFSFGGLRPDKYVDDSNEKELLRYAALYLMHENKEK